MTPRDSSPCWCGGHDWEPNFQTKRFGLLQCPSCGTYRIDPSPLTHEEESPAFYSDYYHSAAEEGEISLENGRGPSRFARVLRQVAHLRRADGVVLDIGCGNGHLCAELKAAGWSTVVGVDVSRSRIARARESYPDLRFSDHGPEAAGIAPATLDLAILDNVMSACWRVDLDRQRRYERGRPAWIIHGDFHEELRTVNQGRVARSLSAAERDSVRLTNAT